MSTAEHETGARSMKKADQHRLSAIAKEANGTPLEYIDVSVEPETDKTNVVEPAKKPLKEANAAYVLYDVDAVPPWYLCILLGFQVYA